MIVNVALTPPANDIGSAQMCSSQETVLVTQDTSDLLFNSNCNF